MLTSQGAGMRSQTLISGAATVVLLGSLLQGVAAAQESPPNDDFADAQVTSGPLPLTVTGTNERASGEPGEPHHSYDPVPPDHASVWYRWTATVTGRVSFDTCASTYDSRIAVYTGAAVQSLTALASNDDGCGPQGPGRAAIDVTAGVTYSIAVDGFFDPAGTPSVAQGDISLRVMPVAIPGNDDMADALDLEPALPTSAAGNNLGATAEPEEPGHFNTSDAAPDYDSYGQSVWYRWVPAVSERVAFDPCWSALHTVLAVYQGSSYADLTPVGRARPSCSTRITPLILDVTAGVPYLLALDGFYGQQGDIAVEIRSLANDNRAGAASLSADLPVVATGNTAGATAEPGEPSFGGAGASASLWYSWTPAASGAVIIDTCGSGFDTVLGVYTEASGGEALPVTASDDDGCAPQSRATVSVRAGTRYLIAVDGFGGASGPFHLSIDGDGSRPTNDAFDAAQTLPAALPVEMNGTTVGASAEPEEPEHAGAAGGGSVWYGWAPAESGPVVIDTCTASTFDTVLAVYRGSSLPDLVDVVSNDDSCSSGSRVLLDAAAGDTYWIAVDTFAGGTGAFTLTLGAPTAPVNDDRADAVVLPAALPVTVRGTNARATAEPDEPAHHRLPAAASVWYSWTPEETGVVVADTCGSTFDTILAVYGLDAATSLSPVVSNDDRCGSRSLVSFAAEAGTIYWIAVDGYLGAEGEVQLALVPTMAPANDERDAGAPIPSLLPVEVTGTNVDATEQPGEPDHHGASGGTSVWYRWTAPDDGPVSLEVCAAFAAIASIYPDTPVPATSEIAGAGRCDVGRYATFTAQAGTPYLIVVDGFTAEETGDFTLRLRQALPPTNDAIEDSVAITGALPATATGDNTDATLAPGERLVPGVPGGASVWYRWTAPTTGGVVIDTCGSTFDTQLAVYAGADPADVVEVGSSDDDEQCGTHTIFADQGSLGFRAAAGTTYWIAVGGYDSTRGTVGVRIRATAPNDYFVDAQTLDGPLPITIDVPTADLTEEPGPAGEAGRWYRWTPSSSARVTVETCGWADDTEITAYTGTTLESLTTVGESFDSCGAGAALTFDAVSGTAYSIAIDGRSGGPLTIRAASPRPANDDFASARVLTGRLPVVVHDANVGATLEPGEPTHNTFLGNGASLWYQWTAPFTGEAAADLTGSSRFLAVAVYTGNDVAHLTREGLDYNGHIRFRAVAGTRYRIAVDRAAAGLETSAIQLTLRRATLPPNDDFEHATVLGGSLPATVDASNVDATRQGITTDGENPTAHGRSIWFDWSPVTSGPVVLETCGSRIPSPSSPGQLTPALAEVFTGGRDDLRRVPGTSQHQYCDGGTTVAFDATAGTTYHIVADSEGDGMGPIRLTVRRPAAPPNDHLAAATVLPSTLPASVGGSNRDASRQPREPDHSGNGADDDIGLASIWFRWTAPADVPVVFETCGSAIAARLRVYTGADIATLVAARAGADLPRACGTAGPPSSRYPRIDAVAGTTYAIAVYGATETLGEMQGDVRLTVRAATPPANDAFDHAVVLAGRLPISVDATLVDATSEPGEGGFAGTLHSPSVWFTWTATADERVVVETCGSTFHSVLDTSVGPTVAHQQPVDGDTRNCGDQELQTIDAHAGTTYRIAVSGTIDQGPIRLAIHRPRPPANDGIAAAPVVAGRTSVAGTNRDAGAEAGEPVLDAHTTGASVWYRWRAPATGMAALDTCDSDFPAVVAVFTGHATNDLNRLATGTEACGGRSRLAFPVTRGSTYLVAVDGRDDHVGEIRMGIQVERR